MDEKELILLIQSNPSEGFREAINTYGSLLTTVVSRILKDNPLDAEECVADTFVAVWKNTGLLNEINSLKGYLICVARNHAIDRWRKIKRYDNVSLDIVELPSGEDVELSVIKKEAMTELQRLITEMGEPDREIFTRKYFLFESQKEIASCMGLEERQVKDRLYRSRQRLKKLLEERGITYETI